MLLVVRIGLVALTAFQGLPSLWAAVFPLNFYRNFPTPDRAWITLFPPYNEHMTHDFGLVGVSSAVVLGYAALSMRHGLVRTVLIASLVFNLPHLIYHQHHVVPGSDVLVQLASLVAPVVLALALLVANEMARRAKRTASSDGPERLRTAPEG